MKIHYSEPYESILHPASLNFTETFLEAVFWKPFHLFCHFLNYVSGNRKVPSLPWWFQSRKQVKIRWCQVRRVWGILQCHHIVCWEILDQNWLVCWSIVLKDKPTFYFIPIHFSRCFLLTDSLRWWRILIYIYLFTVLRFCSSCIL